MACPFGHAYTVPPTLPYNQQRPHSALGMRTPAAFAAEWDTSALPAAA